MNAVSRGPKNKKFIFGGVRAEAVGNLNIKNGRKTPKTAKGGQCK